MIHVVNCDNFHKGKKNYTMREVGLKGAFLFFFCNETLRGRPSWHWTHESKMAAYHCCVPVWERFLKGRAQNFFSQLSIWTETICQMDSQDLQRPSLAPGVWPDHGKPQIKLCQKAAVSSADWACYSKGACQLWYSTPPCQWNAASNSAEWKTPSARTQAPLQYIATLVKTMIENL